MEKKGWKITAIISIVAAIIFLIFWIYANQSNTLLVYEYNDMYEDWCEVSNDWVEIYNIQLESLKEYDYKLWGEAPEAEIVNCYE